MTCGCNNNSRLLNYEGCCNDSVVPAPAACCVAHDTINCASVCLHTTTNVTTTATTFYLSFSNDCDNQIPIDANKVYFYHPSAGFIQIQSVNTTVSPYVYTVSLVDVALAGEVISPDDCVLVTVQQSIGGGIPPYQMCLSGNFTAPALNAEATIYILNGISIPIGSIITFVANGEIGSYTVMSFISATDDIYAYSVKNTGSGHTPGTLIIGDCTEVCSIPINITTTIDICDLDESVSLDTILGCVNGSPRGMPATGEGYVPVGTTEGKWEQQKITNLDCCIILAECMKFTPGYINTADQVHIETGNISCFEEAWAAAVAANTNLPMTINGFQVIITGYDEINHIITVQPVDPSQVTELMTFDAGEELCVGSCCETCVAGAQVTNHQLIAQADSEDDAVVGITTQNGAIDAGVGMSYWLVGFVDPGFAPTVLELDAGYFGAPGATGPILPKVGDPCIFRQKIANTSPYGCTQFCKVRFNYTIYFHSLPADVLVDYELGHYAASSATLIDGITPNPNSIVSTQCKVSGRLIGPSDSDALIVPGSFGSGNNGGVKIFPYDASDFRDFMELRSGDCIMSIVWCFFRVNNGTQAPVSFDMNVAVRRHLEKSNWNLVAIDKNNPDAEDFKA